MYLLRLTDAQLQKMYKMLDDTCKRRGLEGIEDTVDLYNTLISADKLVEAPIASSPLTEDEKKVLEEVSDKQVPFEEKSEQ